MDRDQLWDVHAHQWHSEHARTATEHEYYDEAVQDARCGRNAVGLRWDPIWMRTWADVEAVKRGCWFDVDRADHAVAFFRLLRHTKGDFAGKPFVLLPWQRFDVVMPLFGWRRQGEGGADLRRFGHGYIEIPKKNGKSTLCSGISLYMLIADGEAGAEVYNVAADKKQATIVFREAMRMAKACPYIKNRLRYRDSIKHIDFDEQNGEYEALSSDVGTKEGMNISALVFDELHAQRNRDLFDTLIYGGAARTEPLFVAITTAGVYDPTSIGWEQHEYARRVLEGGPGPGEDSTFFAYIRCCVEGEGETENWLDPYWWYRANPSLGVAIPFEKFEQEAKQASEVPSKQNSFKRYKVNVWVMAAEAAFKASDWQACTGARSRDELAEFLEGRKCFAGLDLSASSDLTAFVLWFPPEAEDDPHYILEWFWLPEGNILELERKAKAPYTTWARDGWLNLTPGNVVDLKQVRKDLVSFRERFDPVNWRYDKWSAVGLVTDLIEEDGFTMVEFGQGFGWMNGPTSEFENLLIEHDIRHAGHPVMGWMIGNCQFDRDSEDRKKIIKSKKQIRMKVDGPVAAVMALDGALRDPAPRVLTADSLTIGG